MNDLKPNWEGLDDVEIVRLPPGESGQTPRQLLTAQRLEAIAEWFATPDSERTPKDIVALARALGASTRSIRLWQRDPRMLRRVREKTLEFLTYMIPNVLWAQYQEAMERRDPKAANIVLSAGGIGGGAGRPPVQVMTQVNVSQNVNVQDQDEIVLAEVNEFVERRVRGRIAALAPTGTPEAVPGDQEKPAVEAVLPHPSHSSLSQLEGPDPSSGGAEPGG